MCVWGGGGRGGGVRVWLVWSFNVSEHFEFSILQRKWTSVKTGYDEAINIFDIIIFFLKVSNKSLFFTEREKTNDLSVCTSIQQFREINWIDFYPEDIGLTRPYVIEWVVIHIMGLSTSWSSVFKWFLPTSLFCSVNVGAVEIVHVVSFVLLKRLENPFLKTVLLISQGHYQGLMLEEKDWLVGRSPCPNCCAFLRFAWMHGFKLKHNKKRAHAFYYNNQRYYTASF